MTLEQRALDIGGRCSGCRPRNGRDVASQWSSRVPGVCTKRCVMCFGQGRSKWYERTSQALEGLFCAQPGQGDLHPLHDPGAGGAGRVHSVTPRGAEALCECLLLCHPPLHPSAPPSSIPSSLPFLPEFIQLHCPLSPEQGCRRTAVNHRAWRSPFSQSRQRRKLSRSDAPVWNHQHFSYESLCNILPQALARRSLCFTSWLPPKNLLQTVRWTRRVLPK